MLGHLLILAILAATPSGRKAAEPPPSPFEGKPVINLVDESSQKLGMARKMMAMSHYQEAADVLELLAEKNPDDPVILNLLRNCYDQLGRYDRSEEIVRRQLQSSPGSFGYRLALAESIARQGRVEDAAAAYRTADSGAVKGDLSRRDMIVRSMLGVGLDSLCLQYIDQVRADFKDSLAFAIERGGILERRGQFEEAAREYLPVLDEDTTSEAGEAEAKLLNLLDYSESSARVEKVLANLAQKSAGVRAMRLLADYYLKADRFDEAFAYTLRLDSLEGHSGWSMMNYVRRCSERQVWPQADSAAAYVLKNYPGSKWVTEASFDRARALAALGRPDEAIAVYRDLLSQGPPDQIQSDAVYGIGAVFYNYLSEYDSALVYFNQVLTGNPRGRSFVNASLAIPKCHLKAGRLDAAVTVLHKLAAMRLPDDAREEVEYLQGAAAFFGGKFDSAKVDLNKLIVDFPKGFFVNDALDLLVVLEQAQGTTEVLDDYSDASYLMYQGRVDSAETRLRTVIDAPDRSLADRALDDLMNLELGRADTTAALKTIDRLDKEFPESYYRPLALKIKADVLAGTAAGIDQARDLYRYLLENCQEYPFAGEVREKLRALEPSSNPVG